MPAKLFAYGGVFAAIFVAGASITRAEDPATVVVVAQPTQPITLRLGISTMINVSRRFATLHIIDPNIVDAVAESDRMVNLVPKSVGATNIDILDEKNVWIARLYIRVDHNIAKAQETMRETYEGVPGRIKIHNHKRLGSATIYSCGSETTVPETVPEEVNPRIASNDNRLAAGTLPTKYDAKSTTSRGCELVEEIILKSTPPELTTTTTKGDTTQTERR
jgi:Flp pilus assembly secretin CpaC